VIPVTEMGIDTRTPMGKAMDHGAVLGRPRSMPDDVVARIVRERAEARLPTPFARDLSKDAVPTAQGARVWSQATVCALLTRERRARKGQAPDRPR
jgi:hypothetical protein